MIAPHYGTACADHTSGGGALARMLAARLAEDSSLFGDQLLLDRTLMVLRFVRRWQRPTGLIDLPKVRDDGHRLDLSNAAAAKGAIRLVVPLITPIRHTIEIRAGRWSEALRSLNQKAWHRCARDRCRAMGG